MWRLLYRTYSVMPKEREQDDDWEGNTEQPQEYASAEAHGLTPISQLIEERPQAELVPPRPHRFQFRTNRRSQLSLLARGSGPPGRTAKRRRPYRAEDRPGLRRRSGRSAH